ncbi:MAG: hypothetical protein FJ318_03280 [SAR202 cluster bacterium]|nr:hypothetical protein [SAR202 cluster bacterium]
MRARSTMTRRRKLFVSFDYANDRSRKDFFATQSRQPDATFTLSDWSLPFEEPLKEWVENTYQRINRADAVVVMVGHNTIRAPGVQREVHMAKLLGKDIYQLLD